MLILELTVAYGVRLHVWGERACLTRPEMKAQRVSYDVPPPSADRGILEAVHWKPAIVWVVDRIHVLQPIRFQSFGRNEVGVRASAALAKRAMASGDLAGRRTKGCGPAACATPLSTGGWARIYQHRWAEIRFSRTLRAVWRSGVEDTSTAEWEPGTAIHGALEHLQPVDLALDWACGPRQVERGLDGGDVPTQARSEVFQRRCDRRVKNGHEAF